MLKKKCLALLMIVTMISIGCGTSELRADVQTAEAVAQSAGNILSAVNPQAGALLVQAAGTLKELDSLIGQYDAAVAAGKPGIATQIQAVTSTLTANLTDILETVRIKNPELLEYITVAVAVANSVITVILQHLPSSVSPQAIAVSQSAQLPVITTWQTHKDLKAAWNNRISKAYPQAKI